MGFLECIGYVSNKGKSLIHACCFHLSDFGKKQKTKQKPNNQIP